MMPSSSGTRKKLANRPSSTATPPSSPRKSQRRTRGETIDDSRLFIAQSLGKVDRFDILIVEPDAAASVRSKPRIPLQRHRIGYEHEALRTRGGRRTLKIH